nr:oleate hydratase [Mucilaginibacter lappiensis]
MHRFIHEFVRINTLAGVDRTPYNQFDSLAKPLIKWLTENGVNFKLGYRVTDLNFKDSGDTMFVDRIQYVKDEIHQQIQLKEDDLVLVTIGSMTADSSLGSMHSAPKLITDKKDGSWKLWENIAKVSPEFGRPFVFDSRVGESKWESFTVTFQGDTFFSLMEQFSGNAAGTGGLVTFKDSNWLMSVVLAYQPNFIDQPENITVFWAMDCFRITRGTSSIKNG